MLRKYLKNSSGQFAIMFSICATALVLGVAGSIDLMGIQKQKLQLQSMTDAAVLAAAATKSDNPGELRKIAETVILSNNLDGKDIDYNLKIDNDIITVTASTNYNTRLMGVIGLKELPVKASSDAPIPKDIPMNIALVLDRTGSMQGANMDSLKSASNVLTDTFKEFSGEIKIGVVPFSSYVNVGVSNRNENWMDVPIDSSTTGAESCYMTRDIVDSSLCTTTEYAGTCSNGDGGAYSCTKTKQTCPDSAYGAEYETCYTPTTTMEWFGCAGSRAKDLHKIPDYRNTPIPGIMNISCGEEVLQLTQDVDAVKAKISSLSASGSTYIPSGLIWGWRLLDSKDPFDDLSNGQDRRKRAIVLMTDGANTRSLTGPTHDGSDFDAADTLTSELCTGIKKNGIEIYTVAYKLESANALKTKDILRKCASSPASYFDASNTEQLENAFEDIARSLFEVRLSR